MARSFLPDIDTTLATIKSVASAPTAPYHEFRALRAIRRELERNGITAHEDPYGQVTTHVSRGNAKRALALVAHTDHPAFEITEAHGREGRARILGGLYAEFFASPVPVLVYDDADAEPFAATLDDYTPAADAVNNSPGHCRIRGVAELRAGQWAVMDLPPFVVSGDELQLRAADDLALCAVVVLVLAALRALLTGGTCESSAFVRLGWSATAIAVPNVNYHNQSDASRAFVPEIVRLSDLRSAVALLVEAAAAAGIDAEESWWPDVRVVPRQIRDILRVRR